jgi:cytochrome P450
MAFYNGLVVFAASNPFTTGLALAIAALVAYEAYLLFWHPLARIPGPLVAKISPFWLLYHCYIGDELSTLRRLHFEYGPILRIGPYKVDISDADAIPPLYITQGGFIKDRCYENFAIDGHLTIFSTVDMAKRAPRVKAVMPLFSTSAIRASTAKLYGCCDQFIVRLKNEISTGQPVNILNTGRSLAIDLVTTHLLQHNYDGTHEKELPRLSASAFVDSIISVGRFFYLPPEVFKALTWTINKIVPTDHIKTSSDLMDQFIDQILAVTKKGDATYPGKLMDTNISVGELRAQVKDLMLAGTDSTGTNIGYLVRALVMDQQKLVILEKELEENKKSANPLDIQSLPYLSGAVKESFRLSMASSGRLPRQMPPGGWTFKGHYFPPGVEVGCTAFVMGLDPDVFPEPEKFKPERWSTPDDAHREQMHKQFFPFGVGSRMCIARNLATSNLHMLLEKLVESRVLVGAKMCQEELEWHEWFNVHIKGDKILLEWPEGLKC